MISNSGLGQLRAVLRALKFVRPYWHVYLLIFIMMILSGTVSSLPAMFVSKIDRFLPLAEGFVAPYVAESTQRIAGLALVTFGGILGTWIFTSVIFNTFITFLRWYLGVRISLQMRLDFFRHLEKLPLSFFQKRPVGELMYRSSNDVDASVPLVLHSIPGMFSSIYNAGFYVFLIISSGATWLIYVLLVFSPIYVGVHFMFSRLRKLDYNWRVRSQQLNATLRESVAGARVVKAFNKQRFEALRYFHRMGEFYRANQRRYFLWLISQVLQKSSIHAGYPMLYPILGAMILMGRIDAIQYVGILLFCRSALYHADLVYQNFQTIRVSAVPVQRLFETLDIAPAVAEDRDARAMEPLEGRVEFKNVSFSYVPGNPVLKGVSFSLEPGQKLGIVGPSGAGKSTIASLLFRFWDPDSGEICIDAQDVRTLKMNTVLKQMGVILQFTHLFSGTIADNIRYGYPDATDEEVIAAAKMAGLHRDISSFPLGYQTDVGEGEKLSGGQRQRVAIARALVKKPRMLVMDEPTASLDPKTASIIGGTLREISTQTTTLIISHRLSDVEDADLVLVMEDGVIAEQGRHTELMAKNGLYAMLYRQQQNTGQPAARPRAQFGEGGEAYV